MKTKNYNLLNFKAIATVFVIAFVFFTGFVGVAQTVFSENMGTPGGTTPIASNVFQNNGTLTYSNGGQTNSADVRATSGSNNTGASGGGNVFFTSASGAYGFSIESINASSYTSLSLSYGYRKESGTLHATFSVDYWDGTAWQTLANTNSTLFNEATNATAGWYAAKTLSLPAAAQINGLKIRFVKTGTASIRIDDVKLTGTLNVLPPNTNSTATISPALASGTTSTVTCTAKDSNNNLVSGYNFKFDVTITNNDATTAESYTIDGASFTTSDTSGNIVTATTNASGVATFTITLPATIDANDGISVQVQLSDDSTNIGSAFSFTQAASQQSQTITFGALSPVSYGDAPFGLMATASSGLAVTYTSSNTAVATVSGSTVTIVGVGTTDITASQAGNSNYFPATDVIQTLTVNKANQTITFGSLPTKYIGDAPFSLTATASSGLPVSYTSSNPAVATVSGNTVTIIGVGTSTITASQTGDSNFNPATDVTQTLTVSSIAFTQGNIVVARVGATGQGTAPTAVGTATFLAEYSTTGASGITIALPTTTSGNVTRFVENGTTTSEAQLNLSADGQYLTIGGYDAATGAASVSSSANNRVIARVDSQGSVATTIFAGSTHGSGFRSVVSSNGQEYWTAGNGTGVTTISHAGNTTPATPTTVFSGTTNLRAVSIYNNQLYYSTGSGTTGIYKVGTGLPTTTGQTSSIAISATDPYAYYMVNRGGTNWNCYAAYATSAGIYKWSSSDDGATWTARGNVSTTAVYGIVAKVNGANVEVYATTTTSILKLTDTAAFDATISGTAITLVTAPANTFFRGIAFAPQIVAPVITNNPLTATGTVNAAFTFGITAVNGATSYGATGLPTGLSVNTTTGQITGTPTTAGTYNVSISATNSAGTDTKTLVITVGKADQTITFGPLATQDINTTSTFTLGATSATSSINPITYTSSNTAVATVSGNVVTLVGSGQTIITASQAGSADYNPATDVSQTLNVIDSSKQDQTITFNTLANSTYGDAPFALTATASSSLPVSYTSSNTAVATVSGSTITIVGVGTTTITASQAGDASYNPASNVTQTLTVNQKALTVTATVTPKVYDGTTTASITNIVLSGVVGSDDVTVTGNSGTFADPNVANGISVSTNFTLSGANASNYTLTQPTLTGDITPANQTITFNALGVKSTLEPDFTLGAFSATSSTNPITYSSSDTNIVTVSGNIVHIVGAGTATITTSQAASQNYNATTASQTITIQSGLYLNQFAGTGACPTQGNTPVLAVNANGSLLTRSTITCSTASNVFNSSTLNATASINDNSYIEFAVGGNTNYAVNVKSVSFFRQASNTAPNQLEVRYSTDDFATSTSWGSAPLTPTSGSVATWDFTDFTTNNGETVKFRIYPYGTQRADLTATAASTSGAFRLDDINVFGTVVSGPSTAVLSGSPAVVCNGNTASFSVQVTDGQSPYTVVYTDGTSNYTVNNYTSGSAITVTPPTNAQTTYSLVSVSDSHGLPSASISGTVAFNVINCLSSQVRPDLCGLTKSMEDWLYVTNAVAPTGSTVSYMIEATNLTTNAVVTITKPNVYFKFSELSNADYGSPMSIRVKVVLNGSPMPSFGTACTVTVASTTVNTQIGSTTCGTRLGELHFVIPVVPVSKATSYTVEVSRLDSSNAVVETVTYTTPTSYNAFALTDITGLTVAYDTSYSIRVKANTVNGTSNYGSSCVITTRRHPSLAITSGCNTQMANSGVRVYSSSVVSYGLSYRFYLSTTPLTLPSAGTYVTNLTGSAIVIDTHLNLFTFSQATGYVPNTAYYVLPVIVCHGKEILYGTSCTITSPATGGTSTALAPETNPVVITKQVAPEFKVVAYPNPFDSSYKLNMTTVSEETVSVKVYDMLGKQVEDRNISVTDLEVYELGNNLPSGVYNVIVSQGTETKTIRVIKK